ncbi:MAG: NmrA family NAD(P)-binding protein [Thermoleophilaceae bacterium]|nr:NmrA family NAD(P)-binding protein [Thermoleophilaceae bacterium]
MLLLTGATGSIGTALLPRLTAAGTPVRCLVRDPRRLGADRVRVQIAARLEQAVALPLRRPPVLTGP